MTAALCVLLRRPTQLEAMIYALYTDNRCQRCGYRNDHPFVDHGTSACNGRFAAGAS